MEKFFFNSFRRNGRKAGEPEGCANARRRSCGAGGGTGWLGIAHERSMRREGEIIGKRDRNQGPGARVRERNELGWAGGSIWAMLGLTENGEQAGKGAWGGGEIVYTILGYGIELWMGRKFEMFRAKSE